MVTAYYKSTLGAFVDTNGERHLLPMTAITTNLARVSWVNSFKHASGAFSLGPCHCEKASPSYIADCLGEMAILHHPANVQVFDRDRVETPDQTGRNLVMKILATSRDFQVRFGHFDSLLCAALRSLFLARKSPLLSLQIIKRALEMARVRDFLAVRERGEAGDADIHADGLAGRWQRFRSGRFAYDQRIPAVNTARDAKLFAFSFNWAGDPDATGSNTWNRKLVAFERTRANLLVFLRESVIAVFALESGKARLLSVLHAPKEALESFVNTFERVLLNHSQMALYFGQGAGIGQMARLFDVAERLTCNLVTRNSFSKSGVVNLARVFKLTLARLNKALIDAKLEFVSLDCGIFSFSHCVTFSINVALWRDLMKGCNLSSGRFSYTTIGQFVKQQNAEREESTNALERFALWNAPSL
jgi:hypothetical protein